MRLPPIMDRAAGAGAAGMLLVGSRRDSLLYRHVATFDGALTPWPMAIVARDDGLRLARLARAGETRVVVDLGVRTGPPFRARNVVAEIPGRDEGDGIVLAGAHIDSWGLGTGALDNGANCVMLLDVARQIAALGVSPRRTIRIVLFSGEEQGLFGSLEYARAHRHELDRIAAAVVFDLGTGRITGFSLGGREELRPLVADALRPVRAYDADRHSADAFLGTDNFDFLLEGVPNLVATQAPANYMEHYHASSDTFDKVDVREMKINGAIAASLVWGLANAPERVARQDRAEINKLIKRTGLLEQMRTFGVLEQWESRSRGRSD
jgi:Zn-dependent M28 family amino/carboxypeptidase